MLLLDVAPLLMLKDATYRLNQTLKKVDMQSKGTIKIPFAKISNNFVSCKLKGPQGAYRL